MTLHVIPQGDLIVHTSDSSCVCGPHKQIEPGIAGEPHLIWVHWSLDGRETREVQR